MPKKKRQPTARQTITRLTREIKQAELEHQLKEVKRSRFGSVSFINVRDNVQIPNRKQPIIDLDRQGVLARVQRLYYTDQMARPIINILASALLRNPPDFQGKDELVKEAQDIVEDSQWDWLEMGTEYWLFGEVFLRIFEDDIVRALPPINTDIDVNDGDPKDVKEYIMYKGTDTQFEIDPEDVVHIKTNSVTNQLHGESDLKHIIYWFDVLDNLWERGWIRTAQYYGSPVISIEGIPANAQAAVEAEIRDNGWNPGKVLILPGGNERERPQAKVLNFGEGFEMQNLVDRVHRYIVVASGIPQSLLMESDASRGVAMFSQPSFEFKIKSAQNKWSTGLKDLFVRMFKRSGKVDSETKLRDVDFKIGWLPIFAREDKDFIKSLTELVTNKVISKKTAREKLNIDNSVEEERLKKESKEDEAALIATQARLPGAAPNGPQKPPVRNVPAPVRGVSQRVPR